ncbi:MAG: methyltransferase domain-containing protein [Gemmatimonadales bacterium]|nr:methyltransferase domain-containing protein [Gemmatimonadales bacterium]
MELVRDLAEEQPAEFHRFLWKNHLAYAETYEIAERFGEEKLHPSRQLLFADVSAVLRKRGVNPAADVRSAFEVGCSMGYLLRYMETRLFPSAEVLEGVDIDEYAVSAGAAHLAAVGSKVRIACADIEDLGGILQGRRFDVMMCPGVLMYVPQENAFGVVESLLAHTGGLLVLTGPAHPDVDNARLVVSARRERDQTFIHNLDRMIEGAGGRIVHRRWEGKRAVGGNTIYFVIAEPASAVSEPA